MRIIQTIYESARRGGQPLKLGSLPPDKKPTPRQEIHRPAVPREPKLVKVESASQE